MFKDKEIQLLIPKQRINYIDQNGNQTKQVAFHSSYFCHKILPKQIIFTELNKVKNNE